jgi:trans-aconitate methyltransferase
MGGNSCVAGRVALGGQPLRATRPVLRPFFSRLPSKSAMAEFATDVMALCRDAYPTTNRGTIIYIQKRLFFIAYNSP